MDGLAEAHGEVLACIRQAFAAFNRGDVEAFRQTWSDSVVAIINEAPPHVWTGDDVVMRWLGDSRRAAAAADPERDRQIALKQCLKLTLDGDQAFVVLIVTMSAVRGDQRIEEDGVQISCLTRRTGSWKVAALAYGGGLATRSAAI